MLRITLDTNILVSATISRGNEYKLLEFAKLGRIKLVLSLPILREFEGVISRTKFNYPRSIINEVVKNILNVSEIVVSEERISIIKEDLDDNMVLECGIAGNVDYIVSGDNHLLKLKKYKDIKIMNSSEILKLIHR